MNVIPISTFPIKKEYFLKIYEGLKERSPQDVYHYAYRYLVEADSVLNPIAECLKLRHEIFFLTLGSVQHGLPIHKDGGLGMEYYASLNLPLLNCNSLTETVFYEDGPDIFESKFGARFYTGKEPLKESERFQFSSMEEQFYLFNSDRWHQVIHKPEFHSERVMMAWRFKQDVKMKEALTLISNLQSNTIR